MPDMRRFVGIDARVLDQHLAGGNVGGQGSIRGKRRSQLSAANADVDVPGARYLKFLEAWNRTDAGNDLLGNLARRLAKFLCELESQRQRILAKLDFRRLLDDDVRDFQVIRTTQ